MPYVYIAIGILSGMITTNILIFAVLRWLKRKLEEREMKDVEKSLEKNRNMIRGNGGIIGMNHVSGGIVSPNYNNNGGYDRPRNVYQNDSSNKYKQYSAHSSYSANAEKNSMNKQSKDYSNQSQSSIKGQVLYGNNNENMNDLTKKPILKLKPKEASGSGIGIGKNGGGIGIDMIDNDIMNGGIGLENNTLLNKNSNNNYGYNFSSNYKNQTTSDLMTSSINTKFTNDSDYNIGTNYSNYNFNNSTNSSNGNNNTNYPLYNNNDNINSKSSQQPPQSTSMYNNNNNVKNFNISNIKSNIDTVPLNQQHQHQYMMNLDDSDLSF